MGTIHKGVKKTFLLVLAFMLVMASGIIASASGGNTPMSKVELRLPDAAKKTTSYILYTNEDAVVGEMKDYQKPANANSDPKFEKMQNVSDTIILDVVTWKKGDNKNPSNVNEHFYTVSSNNQKVASVVKLDDGKIKITAKGNGTATITVKDKYSTKKAVIKITVKTLVEDIAFSETTVNENNEMTVGVKGSLSLGAVVNPGNRNAASAPKLTYKILPVEGMTERDAKAIASVNAKGVVSGKTAGTVRVLVTAQDQTGKYTTNRDRTANVKVGFSEVITVHVSNTPVLTSLKGVDKTVDMKANVANPRHTYTFDVYATGQDGKRVENSSENVYYTFASSRPSVATVDPVTGEITAVKTGTAKITAAPADGTKGVKAVTLTVKVTTDPDKINVPNENVMVPLKSSGVNIGATVDKTVSSKEKKLTYEVISCQMGERDLVAEDKVSDLFTINASGKITPNRNNATQCGEAVIKITSAVDGWAGVPRYVHVHVVDPVKTLTAKVESTSGVTTKSDKINKSITLYVGEGEFNKALVTPDITTANGRKDVEKGVITYTSNKPSVATVDAEGNVTAHAKGTATITIAANDGSKKKTTVTIKVVKMVTDINIANAVYDSETGEYSVAVLPETKKVTLGVTMNKDANTRKVNYAWDTSEGKNNVLSLTSGISKDYTCTITAVDTNVKVPEGVNFFKEVKVHVSPAEGIQFVDAENIIMKKGDKVTLQTALFDNISKDSKNTRWTTVKVDQAGVVTVKDGVVTAKKTGEMQVAYQIKENGTWKNSKVFNILVTESQADFEKNLNNKIKALVSAEDYTVWTGMKPTFNTKTGTISMTLKKLDALNMSNFVYNEDELFGAVQEGDADYIKGVVRTNFEDELRALFVGIEEGVLDNTYTGVELTSGNSEWSVVRNGSSWVVRDGETEIGTFGLAAYKDAVGALAKEMAKDAVDWSGRNVAVKLMRTVTEKYGSVEYEKTYTLAFDSVSNTQLDTVVDDKIVTAVNAFNGKNEGKEETTGLDSIDYAASSNLAVVKISDPKKPIIPENAADKVDAVADNWDVDLNTVLKKIVNLAKAADITGKKTVIAVSDYDGFKDKQVVVKDVISRFDVEDMSTEAVLEKLKAELAERGYMKLGDLGTTMVSVKATVDYNGMEFTQEYHVIFKVVAESDDLIALDEAQDAKISAMARNVSGNAPFGNVEYDDAANTLNVTVANGDATIKDDIVNKNTKFPTLIKTILQIEQDGNFGKYQKNVEVVACGSRNKYQAGWTATDDTLQQCLGISETSPLDQLDGEKIIVKVYESETDVLTYTIKFEVEESNAKAADDLTETEVQVLETTEETVEEEPVEADAEETESEDAEETESEDAEETESEDAEDENSEEVVDETADGEAAVETVDEEPVEIAVPEVGDDADAA